MVFVRGTLGFDDGEQFYRCPQSPYITEAWQIMIRKLDLIKTKEFSNLYCQTNQQQRKGVLRESVLL